jgi:rhamnulose-1-phosphate aldolase/alcohol dehydrogenase
MIARTAMLDIAKAQSPTLADRWDAAYAASLSSPEVLLYRSNLLGGDKRITNYGGGNTSSKIAMTDPLTGEAVDVLWVKGSGGDLGSMKLDGFATLYLDKLRLLAKRYRGAEMEDEMVQLYNHCTFDLNPRATSIDTPLHGFLAARYVDHVHPDAVIAIAAASESKRITEEIYGEEIGWLPWRRPGFELGMWMKRWAEERPNARGVVLEAHGLFTWGDSEYECYRRTIDTINRAIVWLAEKSHHKTIFGGIKVPAAAPEVRRTVASAVMPVIRGLTGTRKLGHFDDQPAILEFVGSNALGTLAALGTSCPDHFLRTKIAPLVLPFDPATETVDDLVARLAPAIKAYRANYAAYYARCKHPNSPAMRDPNAVVFLIPGVGMMTFAGDKATARIAGEFYVNAINVMRGADTVSTYRGLPEQEAFDIEYWVLEEAKLQRLPKAKSLAGRIAVVTGGAGAIGLATARRLLGEGACVIICDIDRASLEEADEALAKAYGRDVVGSILVDVADEESVVRLFHQTAIAFGGIDILVSNAGIASSAPIEETSLTLWQRNMDILSTGYFLVSREAFRLMKKQGCGGAMVFIASKNGIVASPGASAYCTAKASEIHLARCLALEGAAHGIRVNVVNPDAVLRGSKIWSSEWRAQRAEAYKVDEEELEEVYRQRSMLKLSVFPEDIAEGVYFFASDLSAKSTGNILNVDAGHAPSFTR